MRSLNLQNVEAKTGGGSYPDVTPGGYICRIVNVTDVPDREYLMIDLDIAAGEFQNYYRDLAARVNFWGCTQYWSYKEANLPYFKGNITAVEESNSGYRFSDQSEQDLRGKLVGAVFGEEEYRTNSGEIKCRVRPRFVCSAQRIMDKDFNIPKRKLYDPSKDKRNNRNQASQPGGRADYLNPVMQDAGGIPDDLDAWAQGQKLPWE